MSRHHETLPHNRWLEARKKLLAKEKEFTRLRDELSALRRQLPWERVDKEYTFVGPNGIESLADLFGGCSQLMIYHFMFDPEWEAGCKSCSFWADNFNGIDVHLKHRDISFLAVSRAPLAKLNQYKTRMGWNFKWVSSVDSDFNYDYHVSFTPDEIESGSVFWNYKQQKPIGTEIVGISAFYLASDRAIFHTYSCYQRGVDMMNGAYHYMDLAPKGRDEDALKPKQAWLHRHDEYEN